MRKKYGINGNIQLVTSNQQFTTKMEILLQYNYDLYKQ